MRTDGTGRSSALPVTQIVLGAALAVTGVLGAILGGAWIEWLVGASGVAQIVLGTLTYRRNTRLDEAEDSAG